MAENILNYRNAGGKFYQRDDLLNIYSMTKDEYLRLRPYVNIHRNDYNYYKAPHSSFASADLNIDLNTATAHELRDLRGIGEVLAERIVKYRDSKGGFRSKEELLQVYGIDEELYASISDQIYTSEVELPVRLVADVVEQPKEQKKNVIVDLNMASQTELQQVRGIGPAFSERIVEYRKRLGGFVTKEQLLEIYGIDEDHFEMIQGQIKLNPAQVKRININTASEKELRQHPYMSKQIAEQIVRYRIRKKFTHTEEIKKLMLVDEPVFVKLAPYITVE
jgi:competence ComEA-like helix-hairpin-helix protein